MTSGAAEQPRVVALGGGHGLAAVLRAARRYAAHVTAVVSVADDGGSSGRLRRDLGVGAPGDLRKALVALAGEAGPWPEAFEHRFGAGELEGHALGNLVIVGLADAVGDLGGALREIERLLEVEGRVVPATAGPVALKADVGGRAVEGQVALSEARGPVRDVALVPADAPATPEALEAIAAADQVVLAPGSLYTSLLAVVCVADLRRALEEAPGRVVQVVNLATQRPETEGLDGTDHVQTVLDHGGRVDVALFGRSSRLPRDVDRLAARGVVAVVADVARPHGLAHDPEQLARALRDLL